MSVELKVGPNSIEPSAPRELFALPSMDLGLIPYSAAEDGRILVRATPEKFTVQPLTVIGNWPALLRKRAPAL
jgi:hypothetical protein